MREPITGVSWAGRTNSFRLLLSLSFVSAFSVSFSFAPVFLYRSSRFVISLSLLLLPYHFFVLFLFVFVSLQVARCVCREECMKIHIFIMFCMPFIHFCSSTRFGGSVCCNISASEGLLWAMSSAGPVRTISIMENVFAIILNVVACISFRSTFATMWRAPHKLHFGFLLRNHAFRNCDFRNNDFRNPACETYISLYHLAVGVWIRARCVWWRKSWFGWDVFSFNEPLSIIASNWISA